MAGLGFSVHSRDCISNFKSNSHRLPKGIYRQQNLPLGFPAEQGAQFNKNREVPFPKKEKKGKGRAGGPEGRGQGKVPGSQTPHLGRCSAPKCQPVSPLKVQGLQEASHSLFPFGGEFVQACPSELGIPIGLEPLSKQLLCHCRLVPLQLVPLPFLSIHVSGLLLEKSRV